MTLEQRLTAEDLQPSKIQPLVTIFEEREVPEKPDHVKDMEVDDGLWGKGEDLVDIDTAVKGLQGKTVNDMINDIDIDVEKLLSVGLPGVYSGDAELLAQAEAALDTAEVRDGIRHGHVANGVDTFNQVCAEMSVP